MERDEHFFPFHKPLENNKSEFATEVKDIFSVRLEHADTIRFTCKFFCRSGFILCKKSNHIDNMQMILNEWSSFGPSGFIFFCIQVTILDHKFVWFSDGFCWNGRPSVKIPWDWQNGSFNFRLLILLSQICYIFHIVHILLMRHKLFISDRF